MALIFFSKDDVDRFEPWKEALGEVQVRGSAAFPLFMLLVVLRRPAELRGDSLSALVRHVRDHH